MPYDTYQAERVRLELQKKKASFYEKKMMGGLIFMVNDKMCIGVDQDRKTGEDRLMARIGPEEYQAALQEKGIREMDFTGKPMRGFIFIYPDGFDRDDDLEFWVDKALAFNPKAKASKKR